MTEAKRTVDDMERIIDDFGIACGLWYDTRDPKEFERVKSKQAVLEWAVKAICEERDQAVELSKDLTIARDSAIASLNLHFARANQADTEREMTTRYFERRYTSTHPETVVLHMEFPLCPTCGRDHLRFVSKDQIECVGCLSEFHRCLTPSYAQAPTGPKPGFPGNGRR